jgi:hypothetical protein
MKHYTPYFEADGSYNERHHPKRSPRPPEFCLDFSKTMADQLDGKVLLSHLVMLEHLRLAYWVLKDNGVLPDNHARRLEKQITMKAERCIRTYNKAV